jgi:ABC-type transporter Mla subunit MlaD
MKREIKVGLTLIVGILLFYLVIAWVKRSGFFAPDQQGYVLVFEQVNGLLKGDPVVVRGYPSGRVVDIRPDARQVWVEVDLDRNITLLEDAYAEIQIKELMGGKQVAIWPGERGAVLAENAQIPGRTSLDFSTAFSRFGQVLEQFSPEQMDVWRSGLDSLGQAFGGTFDPAGIRNIMLNLEELSFRLNQQTASLDLRQWNQRGDSLLNLATEVLLTSQDMLQQFHQISLRLEENLLPQGETLLQQTEASLGQLTQTLDRVEGLLTRLQDPSGLMGKALNDPVFAARLDTTLTELNKTLKEINEEKFIVGFRRK